MSLASNQANVRFQKAAGTACQKRLLGHEVFSFSLPANFFGEEHSFSVTHF